MLRTYPLGEADRIVTLLTYRHGVVRAVAKGARRPSSRFGSRLESMNRVQLMLHQGRNLATVSAADSLDLWGTHLSADYVRWAAGQVLVETTGRIVAEDHEPAMPQYRLLGTGLRALCAPEQDPRLVIDAFLLQSMATGGWAPTFADCAQCGNAGPHPWLHLPSGGTVCADCRPSGSATVNPATVRLLGDLLSGEWDSDGSLTSVTRRAASSIVAAYLQLHLERQLRSLPLADKAWLQTLAASLREDDVMEPVP